MKNSKLKAVDFFCGGGGMSYGMQSAGIQVLAGIDYEPSCKETYEANINAKFIQAATLHPARPVPSFQAVWSLHRP